MNMLYPHKEVKALEILVHRVMDSPSLSFLLSLSSLVTAVPLMFFIFSTKLLILSNEAFTYKKLMSYILIWIALIIYTLSLNRDRFYKKSSGINNEA